MTRNTMLTNIATGIICTVASMLYISPAYSQRNPTVQRSSGVVYSDPKKTLNTTVKSGNEESPISIERDSSFLRNDTLYIHFDLLLRGKVVESSNALHIAPVYFSDKGEIRFPEILINGKSRSSYYNREVALSSHESYWETKPYALLKQERGKEQRVTYYYAEPLTKELLSGGRLSLEQIVEDCCNLKQLPSLTLGLARQELAGATVNTAAPSVTNPVYESSVTFIRPIEEKVKERSEQLTVRINFIVGRHDILPYFANNEYELQKVDRVLRPITSRRETYSINSASIKGYASPESSYEFNMALSQRRADSFRSYLSQEYGLYGLSKFSVQGMGEDWNGLRMAVQNSYMDYKREILSIIDGVGIFDGREKMLMDLAGGTPYRYLLRVLYPPLRRMEMAISYTVRSFEPKEVEAVIKERPQDLSQEEIYELARIKNSKETVNIKREEYGKEYDIAARYFPDDATANINASSAALVRGELDAAYSYLQKVWNNPKAYNNIGVYYLLKGDKQKAEEYFNNALSVDRERAEYNLDLIKNIK